MECVSYPTYTTRPKLNTFQKIFRFLRLYSRTPHLCGTLSKSKPNNSWSVFLSIYFTKKKLKNSLQCQRNWCEFVFYPRIFKNPCTKNISKKTNGTAPVNTNLPGESIANEVSNVDIVFYPKKNSKSDLKKMIQKEIDVGMIYSGKFLFSTLNILGRSFFTVQAWLSQYLLRRTGCFSNLGQFKVSEDINMSFCPPPQRGSCFSSGLITINERFCLRVGIHRRVKMDMEKLKRDITVNLLS